MSKKDILFKILGTTQIPQNKVNCKIIECGNIIQVYLFSKSYLKSQKGYEKIEDNLILKESYDEEFKPSYKQIEFKNLNRSKFQMDRLIKSNINDFKSFITLTFDRNVFDLTFANKEFDKFISKIKRTFPEFLYIGVPEFQKNGRVHYHLLTNIDYYNSMLVNENLLTCKLYQNKDKSQIEQFILNNTEEKLLKFYNKKDLNNLKYCFRLFNGKYENTKCTFNKKTNSYMYFKTIKYWNNGFTNIIPLDNIDVCGYMSKYMTKDFENRLFGHHRYLHGGKLKKPSEIYLNLEKNEDLEYFIKIYNNSFIEFSNVYKDKFGNDINFFELKT